MFVSRTPFALLFLPDASVRLQLYDRTLLVDSIQRHARFCDYVEMVVEGGALPSRT